MWPSPPIPETTTHSPGLASVAIFNFLGLWNQYLIPVAINTHLFEYRGRRIAHFYLPVVVCP